MPDDEPDGRYLDAIRRGFQFAREQGHDCGPADFLVGIAETAGPAAAILDPGRGRNLRAAAVAAGTGHGAISLHLQAQEAAGSLAAALGQPAAPEHLLIALLDQGTAGVEQTLRAAGLDPAVIRQEALAAIGLPPGQPPVPIPPLTPAGTMDRPPLPVTELDARAWTVLRWRQEHLPLGRLRGPGDRDALSHLERATAWRLAARLRLDDDQSHSLVSQHDDAVRRLVASGRPDLAGPRRLPRRTGPTAGAGRGRRHRPPRPLRFTTGWAAWLRNRRTGLRNRWFRLRITWHYRGAPAP